MSAVRLAVEFDLRPLAVLQVAALSASKADIHVDPGQRRFAHQAAAVAHDVSASADSAAPVRSTVAGCSAQAHPEANRVLDVVPGEGLSPFHYTKQIAVGR